MADRKKSSTQTLTHFRANTQGVEFLHVRSGNDMDWLNLATAVLKGSLPFLPRIFAYMKRNWC